MESYSSISIEELVCRCAASPKAELWEEFVRRFQRLIAAVVLRTASRLGDSSKQTVDDLIQETYLKLCAENFRVLRSFEQQHPDAFIGYVKAVAANVARDHFKAIYTQKRGSGYVDHFDDDFVPAASDASAGSPKSIERAVLIQEVTQHLELCVAGPDKERNLEIFWLYYRAGLSARAIADLPGVDLTTKGVESIIMRITRELRERMAEPKVRARDQVRRGPEGFLPA